MRLARGHYASLDPQLLGLKSSTLPPSHCVSLCCLKKMQCSFINPVMSYGIADISFAARFVLFNFFTANNVDPASSSSSFEPCHKAAAIINVA